MVQSDPLVSMVVSGIVAAFALGFLAHKLRLSPIVGYLLAGVLIGPHTPGFAADGELAAELAELGVILIMFGVGLKFSPAKLMAYRWIALPCALGQMALVTGLGFAAAMLMDLNWGESLIIGFSLSIASTIVLLRSLERRRDITTPTGHLAMSWLIVQDAAAVLALVAMTTIAAPTVAGAADIKTIARALGLELAALGAFVLIMIVIGRRLLPGLLVFIAKTKSRELFSLGVFAIALGIAYAAHAAFGASFALGAFLAGLVLNEADLSHRAAEELIPLRDAFSVLFFVSVGMLFDPQILMTQLWVILGVLAIIVLGNGLAAFAMTSAFGLPLQQRLTLATGLSQIGEFSFLICGTAMTLDLISGNSYTLITAGALLSIALNPLLRQIGELTGRKARAHKQKLVDAA